MGKCMPVSTLHPLFARSVKKTYLTFPMWLLPTSQTHFPEFSSFSPRVLDSITPESAAACLRRCRNSAPGPDKISYPTLETIQIQACFIISTEFSICIKIKCIPSGRILCCISYPKG
ncbi:hypothetical protein NPIL_116311 [Nephila pilipes]|uniref:Uncharacterized protein n=1 Tax=Nephila pilipes TaxID=299642 RepID=A0A8X6Q017_NEPPI|nr:hypothetical protein NPIL_116311 [Nephila pilipes]